MARNYNINIFNTSNYNYTESRIWTLASIPINPAKMWNDSIQIHVTDASIQRYSV